MFGSHAAHRLGSLMPPKGNRPPWTLPAKARYLIYDNRRAAARVGITEYQAPDDLFERAKTQSALRALLFIKANHPKEKLLSAMHFLLHRFWTPPNADVVDESSLRALLAEATEMPGGGAKLFTEADVGRIMDGRAEMKKRLIEDTAMVVESGAFGCPWILATNSKGETQPFFGSDRFFSPVSRHFVVAVISTPTTPRISHFFREFVTNLAMQPELTLIVAATRSMGIGLNGTMPWTGLRKEMQYFARVTTRVPPQVSLLPSPSRTGYAHGNPPGVVKAAPNSVNAVIMGRKTWDSIPAKFRPLKNRLNIIVSRQHSPTLPAEITASEPVRVSSLEQAVEFARTHPTISRVFVMGGGQIYDAALKMDAAKRVLLTSIEREYECDTFFGLDLRGDAARSAGWRRKESDEWRAWTGETGDATMEEGGVGYEWQMWERE
ncbi:Dihydrofolate reductase [Metarhizium acridum CQMa 102]|uniref:Dihydrofolate reductase n=1 Tax=Metarhizium acridum (strain CQMa 102) TaxID=655827 RepID=E9EFM2_METAQ|nr:Dihydrofolate reductase [Metarhizium acridum CQMa 102]EFY85314.1 Dihydrofolate reductase [Metarhizium acridum CQMa 102]